MDRCLRSTLVALLWTIPCSAESAQPACEPNEQFGLCFNRILGEAEDSLESVRGLVAGLSAEALVATTGEEVADKPTSGTATESAGSLRNTLAAVLSDLGLGTFDDDDESLTFRFNPERFQLSDKVKLAAKFIARDPAVSEGILELAPEDQREGLRGSLGGGLGEFDDLEIRIEGGIESQRHGRSYIDHQDILGRLFASVIDDAAITEAEDAATEEFTRLVQTTDAKITDTPSTLRSKVEALRNEAVQLASQGKAVEAEEVERTAAVLEGFEPALIRAATGWAEARKARLALIEERNLVRLADLINNQPQLFLDGFYRRRDDLVGPDSFGLKIGGEWVPSWAAPNMNRFRQCQQTESIARCAQNLLPTGAERRAPRLAGSLSFERSEAHRVPLRDHGIELDLDQSTKVVGSLAGGLYTWLNALGEQKSRLDLDVSWEEISDDPTRQDRLVANLTYSQKMGDGATGSIGLVWANKPEFRGEVEEELGARAGLRWGLDRKSQ